MRTILFRSVVKPNPLLQPFLCLLLAVFVLSPTLSVLAQSTDKANEPAQAESADGSSESSKKPAKPEPSKENSEPAKTEKPIEKPAAAKNDAKKSDSEKSDNEKTGEKKADNQKPEEKQPNDKKPMPTKEKAASDKNPDDELVAKGVWTSIPKDGPAALDFSLIGEYVGEFTEQNPSEADEGDSKAAAESKEPKSKKDSKPTKALAVQIRSLGNGEFEARSYEGGLPGQDGFNDDSEKVLIGRRSGDTLVLSGGPWAMFVSPQQCKIINAEGDRLAELPRVERSSSTLGAAAPEGAMVLFDGKGTKAFTTGEMTSDGLLKPGADVNFLLNDFDLHAEFRIPFMPRFLEQKRGNSGFYLQGRYECQVLDSFGAENVFNGLGALYRYKAPRFNMALPPLTWQTYDIRFTAARYAADGSKLRNARVTSWVNGVIVHADQELPGPTGAGQPESPTPLPTKIQDHNDPVRYRNIWVIDRGLIGNTEFPPSGKK